MKILKTFFPVLIFALTACNTGEPEKDYLCVIKSPVIYSKDSLDYSEPVFYGQNNFILYDSKTILYHEIKPSCRGGGCCTEMDYSKPGKLYLTPENLIKINYSELERFLKAKFMMNKNHHHSIISISSPVDTIRNPAYTALIDFQKRHKDVLVSVRKWTEEEQYVATAKMKNKKYDPTKIQWKVGFADGNDWVIEKNISFIQFLPPIVEDSENATKPKGKKKLTKYFYPNMSPCGGALYGYYDDTTLVKIDSKFGGELSLTYQTIEYDHGKITCLIYGQEFPKMEEYHQKYPTSEDIDQEKLTYTNDYVVIDFYPVKKIRTYSNKKIVKNNISEEKIHQLLDCAKEMEQELASEKQLIKTN